jgi:hypothetical protein
LGGAGGDEHLAKDTDVLIMSGLKAFHNELCGFSGTQPMRPEKKESSEEQEAIVRGSKGLTFVQLIGKFRDLLDGLHALVFDCHQHARHGLDLLLHIGL